jgi:sialate O-acetylesterase
MEWVMKNTNDAEAEIAKANYGKIRLFTVEKDMSFKPKTDLKGGKWQECSPSSVADFYAVAYYLGKKLHEEINVPIGLINSSWGGTMVEPWISWDLMVKEPQFAATKISDFEKMGEEADRNLEKFAAAMKNDRGLSEQWYQPGHDAGWKSITLPQEWSNTEIGNTDGIVWFRKQFEVAAVSGESATLSLGPIDDIDITYINGTQVGSEGEWNKERVYKIPVNLLKNGSNEIVVKVVDNQGGGGIYGKPEQLYIDIKGQRISLKGEWLYKTSVLTSDFAIKDVGPNAFPSRLYNAMIAPIVPHAIRGVIWYQGESNASAAYRYQHLFPLLINNWRNKWGYEFPFFWAQLANFMEVSAQPTESEWAELREAQRMALTLPKTGQAVIIDIGEADDIHPRNKRDVGYRLALNALAIEYGKQLEYSGPAFKEMQIENGKAILGFSHTGSGLVANKSKYGYLQGFAVAGEDRRFHWAKAYIDGDKVIVYSDEVKNPVAVRYAWSDNPDDANLYNKEGLPASPFKTDNWTWTTEKK